MLEAQRVEESSLISRTSLLELLSPLGVNESIWKVATVNELKESLTLALKRYRVSIYQ